jgi:hypothetical protein
MTIREVVSLLETGSEELEKGNASAGLSILFEAQCLLNEIVQRQAEMMQGPASAYTVLGLRPRGKGPASKVVQLADPVTLG